MAIIFIGSEALRYNGFNIDRKILDVDIIAPLKEGQEYAKSKLGSFKTYPVSSKLWIYKNNDLVIEHLMPTGSNKLIYDWMVENNLEYIPPELSLAIKMSHRFKKTNKTEFLKTKNDIKMLRNNGISYKDFDAIYKLRMKEVLSYSHPNLNRNKEEFFTDDVGYIYDHDSIHESIKTMDKPAYQYFKPEENEVFCSKSMFMKLSDDIKHKSVIEESWVLTIERALVPFNITDENVIKNRFRHALQKVCTSITSGWFRDYAWEDYDRVMDDYDISYYHRFQEGLKTGVVKPHKK